MEHSLISPDLRIVTTAESRTNLLYAKRRIKQVLDAALKIGDHWPPENEVVPMGRIQLARTIDLPNFNQQTIVFESNQSAAPHLRVRTKGLPIDCSNTKTMTLSVLKMAYAVLRQPEADNDITPFAEDLLDLAALYHSQDEKVVSLWIYPAAESHKLRLHNHLKPNQSDDGKKAEILSNEKLQKLTDLARDRLPLLAQCSIQEKGGAFYVSIDPINHWRHYPKNQRPMGNLNPLEPLRALRLIQEFHDELIASGHSGLES